MQRLCLASATAPCWKLSARSLSSAATTSGTATATTTSPTTHATKIYSSADHAIADVRSGSRLLVGGFGLCGIPETLIAALRRRSGDVRELTVVSNNAGSVGVTVCGAVAQ